MQGPVFGWHQHTDFWNLDWYGDWGQIKRTTAVESYSAPNLRFRKKQLVYRHIPTSVGGWCKGNGERTLRCCAGCPLQLIVSTRRGLYE
jgi:hypothetical protein